MNGLLLQLAAGVTVFTLAVHSYLGERRLIGPILAIEAPITQKPLARAVVRFAWHFMSALGLIVALLLWRSGSQPDRADPVLIGVAGIVILVAGIVDAVMSRFQHIGWPMIVLAGALTLSSFV